MTDRQVFAWYYHDGVECDDCHDHYLDRLTNETEDDTQDLLAFLNTAQAVYLDERSHALPNGYTCACCGEVKA